MSSWADKRAGAFLAERAPREPGQVSVAAWIRRHNVRAELTALLLAVYEEGREEGRESPTPSPPRESVADPDELAIAEAARIIQLGQTPEISFFLTADQVTTGFRVRAVGDLGDGRLFPCSPAALPESMRKMVCRAMEQQARRRR